MGRHNGLPVRRRGAQIRRFAFPRAPHAPRSPDEGVSTAPPYLEPLVKSGSRSGAFPLTKLGRRREWMHGPVAAGPRMTRGAPGAPRGGNAVPTLVPSGASRCQARRSGPGCAWTLRSREHETSVAQLAGRFRTGPRRWRERGSDGKGKAEHVEGPRCQDRAVHPGRGSAAAPEHDGRRAGAAARQGNVGQEVILGPRPS